MTPKAQNPTEIKYRYRKHLSYKLLTPTCVNKPATGVHKPHDLSYFSITAIVLHQCSSEEMYQCTLST